MGYWGVKNLGYGIWAPLCHPPQRYLESSPVAHVVAWSDQGFKQTFMNYEDSFGMIRTEFQYIEHDVHGVIFDIL